MTQWQPIETAPKDGTIILCFDPSLPNPVFVGVWLWHLDDDDAPLDSGSWSFDDPQLWPLKWTVEPTHWVEWWGYPQDAVENELGKRAARKLPTASPVRAPE